MALTAAQQRLLEEFLFENFQRVDDGKTAQNLSAFVQLSRAAQLTAFKAWTEARRVQVDGDLAGIQVNLATQQTRLQQREIDLDSVTAATM